MESSIIFTIIKWTVIICICLFILFLLGANQSKLVAMRDKQIKILDKIHNAKK